MDGLRKAGWGGGRSPGRITPLDFVGEMPDRRKLVALVHMDMVGYSRLMGLDDVGTLGRLQALRRDLIDPAIEERGGRLVNTGGDFLFDRLRQR